MRPVTWAASDIGRRRKENEDSYLLDPELGLVVVADGMGGFERGDVASQLACAVFKENVAAGRSVLDAYRQRPDPRSRDAVLELLQASVQQACSQVHDAASALASGGRMGTTIDVLLVVGSTAFIAHVGDGRIFLFRGREIHQLTEDHTLVAEQLKEGVITPEQARHAPNRSVITRALGAFPQVLVDTLHFELDADDRLLLCSDGLHRYIGPRELSFSMMSSLSEDTVTALVAEANGRGGRDNITVVLCALQSDDVVVPAVLPNRERMEALRRTDLFSACTYRELMAVCQVAEQRSVAAGTTLFEEGEPGLECFFIQQGQVRIEKSGTVLTTLGPGTYFGEMIFLDISRRSATAVVEQDTEFLVLHRDRFLLLLKLDANLSAKLSWLLLKKFSRIIRSSNARISSEPTITELPVVT